MKSFRSWHSSYFVIILTFVVSLMISLPVEGAGKFFEDQFNGNQIDSTLWNTTIATSGNRFCCGNGYCSDMPYYTGDWRDVEIYDCWGYTETAPYGSIDVQGGAATFFAPDYKRMFPYIWSGPPSRPSPFPASGDFILESRIKWNSIHQSCTSVEVQYWENTEPFGGNTPYRYPDGFVFDVCAATPVSVEAWLLTQGVTVANPLEYHVYRVEYIGGAYSLYIDGILRIGPVPSSIRPNSIWIGNPSSGVGVSDGFSSFTIDYFKVLK